MLGFRVEGLGFRGVQGVLGVFGGFGGFRGFWGLEGSGLFVFGFRGFGV